MTNHWNDIFDNWGIKKVSPTDKNRSAYVPNASQVKAIEASGITPSENRPADTFQIRLLGENRNFLTASYYYSLRSEDANRIPEPRIGRQFISEWANIGDNILIGNIGSDLFTFKIENDEEIITNLDKQIAETASINTVIAKAKLVRKKPNIKIFSREEYDRDPYIVQAALIRSEGKCEMPMCGSTPFHKTDGQPYLEVHHIIPLSEGGEDRLDNVAALCPNCHREQHYGSQRLEKRKILIEIIKTKEI